MSAVRLHMRQRCPITPMVHASRAFCPFVATAAPLAPAARSTTPYVCRRADIHHRHMCDARPCPLPLPIAWLPSTAAILVCHMRMATPRAASELGLAKCLPIRSHAPHVGRWAIILLALKHLRSDVRWCANSGLGLRVERRLGVAKIADLKARCTAPVQQRVFKFQISMTDSLHGTHACSEAHMGWANHAW
eukprot:365748-Chlamydomonas_euryale.AAC.10